MPDVTIVLGPAAAGKTAAALRALAAPRRGRALLLLPGELHDKRLRPALDGIRRCSAGSLGRIAHLLLRAAGDTLAVASPLQRAAALRVALRSAVDAGELSLFARVATKRGFVEEALRLIDELRAAAIPPAVLAGAAVSPYDGELAVVYRLYLEAMARLGLSDEHGLIARAHDLVATRPELTRQVDLLVVDGFDQFTPLQLDLVRALAERAGRTLITLTGEATERLAHRRFARTLTALHAALPVAQLEVLPPRADLPPALAHIERQLFALAPGPPIDAGGTVALIGAPDPEREVRAALRQVRALLAAGLAPATIAVLYRGGDRYPQLVREVAAEYALPVCIYEGRPLGTAPPVTALRALLELPSEGFPRRGLVECWRNLGAQRPATVLGQGALEGLDFAGAATLLERATRGVAGGLPRLRATLATLVDAAPPPPDAEQQPPVTPAEAAALLALLDAFVAWLAAPATAPPGEYVAWVRRLLGWHPAPASGAGTAAATPEQTTPERFPFSIEQRKTLERLLDERALVARMLAEPPLSRASFVAELGGALDAVRYGGEQPAVDKVAVLPMLAARGASFAHVVVLGASEGELPARLPEPPFYTRRERTLLVSRGAAPPPADPGDERSIFYEAVARARAGLTLCYTRLDERGNERQPSPYLQALVELFSGGVTMREIRAGSAPALEEAASPQEALIALADADPTLAVAPAGASAELALHVRRAAAIERQRERRAPHGPHTGLVTHPEALAALERRFGPDHRWSATQINDYSTCPYRFAAAHVLRLAPRGDAQEGLEQVGRGRLYHAILASAGERWIRLAAPFDAANEVPILAALDAAATEVLAAAPQRYGFEPGPFWAWEQTEIRAVLARAVRRWLREGAVGAGFRPAGVEVGFGMGRGLPPLRLATPAGVVYVSGRIDRVDQDEQGRLTLIDYKSGSGTRPLADTLAGYDVQLTLYSLAAARLAAPDQPVVQAAYLMIGSGRRSPPLTAAELEQAAAALHERLAATVAGSRSGLFPVQPSRECPPACAFATICRVQRAMEAPDRYADPVRERPGAP